MSRFLKDLAAFLDTQTFPVIRVAEIHDGGAPEVLERMPANPCQNTYSVAKAFTMTAIGLLYDRHLLELDERVCDILADELPDDASEMDDRWFFGTVEMALTHRLGLPGGFLDIDVTHASAFGYDYLDYTFRTPLEYTPGEGETYSDGAYYLLSRIAAKRANMPMENFLWRELFYPLGFREMAWSRCPMGYAMGATGLYITAEDMVKLGQVYLNNGIYGERRILSEEWVRLTLRHGFALAWDKEHKVFSKGGMCGQRLMVAPEQRRVLAMQSYGGDADAVEEFLRNYK